MITDESGYASGFETNPAPQTNVVPPHVRNFLGKVQGVCMGVAMSGRDHPNPDEALLELFEEAQELLFPADTPPAPETKLRVRVIE